MMTKAATQFGVTDRAINNDKSFIRIDRVSQTQLSCVHKQITNRQEHQTHTDDINMRPHTA